MSTAPYNSRHAFTFVELLVVIFIIGALVLTLMHPGGGRRYALARGAACASQLKMVGSALSMYSQDNHQKSPLELVETSRKGTFEYFNLLYSYLGSNNLFLKCPADLQRRAIKGPLTNNASLSYFLAVTRGFATNEPTGMAGPGLLLAGDRPLDGGQWSGHVMEVRSFTRLEWTNSMHSVKADAPSGNLLFTDGHIERLTAPQLRQQLADSGSVTQILVMPVSP